MTKTDKSDRKYLRVTDVPQFTVQVSIFVRGTDKYMNSGYTKVRFYFVYLIYFLFFSFFFFQNVFICFIERFWFFFNKQVYLDRHLLSICLFIYYFWRVYKASVLDYMQVIATFGI